MSTKLLVISDSHGRADLVRRVCELHSDADILLHAGDGASDLSAARADGMKVYSVKGNCDFIELGLSREKMIMCEGEGILLCHGDAYGVKSSLVPLQRAALSRQASIAVFGHTHEPIEKHIPLESGELIHLFNPGSLRLYSYGLIQIKDGSILFSHGRLKA